FRNMSLFPGRDDDANGSNFGEAENVGCSPPSGVVQQDGAIASFQRQSQDRFFAGMEAGQFTHGGRDIDNRYASSETGFNRNASRVSWRPLTDFTHDRRRQQDFLRQHGKNPEQPCLRQQNHRPAIRYADVGRHAIPASANASSAEYWT